jgi:hypothetical protein
MRRSVVEMARRSLANTDKTLWPAALPPLGPKCVGAGRARPERSFRATSTRSAAARAGLRREIDSQAGWIVRRPVVGMALPDIAIRPSTDERRAQARVRKRACSWSPERPLRRPRMGFSERRAQARVRKRACARSPERPLRRPRMGFSEQRRAQARGASKRVRGLQERRTRAHPLRHRSRTRATISEQSGVPTVACDISLTQAD